jgi:hypothetical protein
MTPAIVVLAFIGCAACSGQTAPPTEKRGTTTTGSCGCCGQIVDIAQGQSCSDPAVCATACADASSDAH